MRSLIIVCSVLLSAQLYTGAANAIPLAATDPEIIVSLNDAGELKYVSDVDLSFINLWAPTSTAFSCAACSGGGVDPGFSSFQLATDNPVTPGAPGMLLAFSSGLVAGGIPATATPVLLGTLTLALGMLDPAQEDLSFGPVAGPGTTIADLFDVAVGGTDGVTELQGFTMLVPEPSLLWMLGLPVVMLAAMRRRLS